MTTNDTTVAAARMTEARRELEAEYTIAMPGNRIASPGKFEGERLYVPFYWAMGLEGYADEDGYAEGDTLWLEENDSGFAYTDPAPSRDEE